MKIVIQRVSRASVSVNGIITGSINEGLLLLAGIHRDDDEKVLKWITKKILNLRIFEDEQGKMNKSVKDMKGEILVVSQFTLYGNTKKGNRPSFIDAASPDIAEPVYEQLITNLKKSGLNIQSGEFGAMMDVKLVNSGPVTLIIEK